MVLTSRYFLITLNHPFYFNSDIDDDIQNQLINEIDLDSPLSVVENTLDDLIQNEDFLHYQNKYNNLQELVDYCLSIPDIRGVVAQLEKGGDCNTIHIHIYLELKKAYKWGSIKKLFPLAHLNEEEIRDRNSAMLYAQKEETRIEGPLVYGEFTKQGKRTDLADYKDAIINGAKDLDLINDFEHADSKYHKWGEHVRLISQKENIKNNERTLQVIYLYSTTGQDLVDYVKTIEDDLYIVNDYECMFQTYENEKVVMLDDFVASLDLQRLLPLLKKSTTTLNVKYSVKVASYEKIYICSCVSWQEQLRIFSFDKRSELITKLNTLVTKVINVDLLNKKN